MDNRQIKITEGKILEAINEVLADYNSSEDGLYGSAREAVRNNIGFEKWFNIWCLPYDTDKEDALNIYLNAKRDIESSKYMNPSYSDNPDETPDFNQNVYDFNTGRYAMMAQRQDYNDGGIDRAIGRSKRPTNRESKSEIEKYFTGDSRFNDIINETINKILAKH